MTLISTSYFTLKLSPIHNHFICDIFFSFTLKLHATCCTVKMIKNECKFNLNITSLGSIINVALFCHKIGSDLFFNNLSLSLTMHIFSRTLIFKKILPSNLSHQSIKLLNNFNSFSKKPTSFLSQQNTLRKGINKFNFHNLLNSFDLISFKILESEQWKSLIIQKLEGMNPLSRIFLEQR